MKRKKRLQKIPVYGSSFIAIVAIAFMVLHMPESSEHLMQQNEQKLAKIDRAYEEIQVATTLSKEKTENLTNDVLAPKVYPTYLPKDFSLVKEAREEGKHVLHYKGKNQYFILYMVSNETQLQTVEKNPSYSAIEKKVGEQTFFITGNLPKEELEQILTSIQ